MDQLHQFLARCLWSWLGPPLTAFCDTLCTSGFVDDVMSFIPRVQWVRIKHDVIFRRRSPGGGNSWTSGEFSVCRSSSKCGTGEGGNLLSTITSSTDWAVGRPRRLTSTACGTSSRSRARPRLSSVASTTSWWNSDDWNAVSFSSNSAVRHTRRRRRPKKDPDRTWYGSRDPVLHAQLWTYACNFCAIIAQ